MTTTPVAASPRPLKGAPLANRRSRIRGGRWMGPDCEELVASQAAATRAVGG